jgi:hypothetical protein
MGRDTLLDIPASALRGEKKETSAAIAARPEVGSFETKSPELKKGLGWNWGRIAAACYFIGFGFLSLRFAAGILQARAVLRKAVFVNGRLTSARCASPVTIGWFRARVILPEEWQDWQAPKLDAALAHEEAHIRRGDPLIQGLAILNRCVFWFHPLAWWLERKLSDLAEEACDEAAVRRGHAPEDYAQYLIDMARAAQLAGARVHPWGLNIQGSGGALSNRIHQILNSRPAPPLSRARYASATVFCLLVFSVAAACRPEREAKLATGQPSMNELMHRRAAKRLTWEKERKEVLDEVQKMTPDQAARLESELKANPRDNKKLTTLVRYYQLKRGGQGFNAITLWYIEHEPTFPWAWNINPAWDRAAYDQGKKLWLAHLSKLEVDSEIYYNAARFLEGGDKPLAERVLLDGQKAYPSKDWTTDLGMHYAQALLGSVGPLAEFNVIRAVDMKEAQGRYAQGVRANFAASNDPQLLTVTAQWIMSWSGNFLYSRENPFDFDPLLLAKSFNDRALSLQPDSRGALSIKLHLEETANRLRLRGTPPDEMNHSDRLRLLSDQMDNAFWNKKTDEIESNAQELLTLAAKDTNDPEYGNAVFFANMALGDLALRRGDKLGAARFLLAASAAPPTDRLRNDYIDMTLARQLVDWGEREAVAKFLDRCARLNHRSPLAEWAAQIRKGINPDLLPYRT